MNPTVAGVLSDPYTDPMETLKAQYQVKMEQMNSVVSVAVVREKRKSPYTKKEKKFLAMLASRYLDIIECKKTDSAFMSKKMEAWECITAEFNSARLITQQATLQQLKKLWQNMKNRMKIKNNSGVSNDGDPSISDVSMDNNQEESFSFPIGDDVADMEKDQPSDEGEMTEELVQYIKEEPVTKPEFIDTSKGYYKIQLRPEKRKLASPKTSAEIQHDIGPAKRKTDPPVNKITEGQSYLEQLQIKQIENEIVQREIMFKQNMEHATRMDNLNHQILKLEYEHKRKYYTMIEEEQELRISRLKKANLCYSDA